MLGRQNLFVIVLGLCVINGIFSPYLKIAVPITTVLMPEMSPLLVQFTGPGTCGCVPVKSATTRSPSISTRTRIGNGP